MKGCGRAGVSRICTRVAIYDSRRVDWHGCLSDLGANRCSPSQFTEICGAQIPAPREPAYTGWTPR
jgi:hypothetical protein